MVVQEPWRRHETHGRRELRDPDGNVGARLGPTRGRRPGGRSARSLRGLCGENVGRVARTVKPPRGPGDREGRGCEERGAACGWDSSKGEARTRGPCRVTRPLPTESSGEHVRPGRRGDTVVEAWSGDRAGGAGGRQAKGYESCPAGLQDAWVRRGGNRRGGERPRGRWRPEVAWWRHRQAARAVGHRESGGPSRLRRDAGSRTFHEDESPGEAGWEAGSEVHGGRIARCASTGRELTGDRQAGSQTASRRTQSS